MPRVLNPAILFLIFFTSAFLIFLPGLHSKFVADFLDMAYGFQKYGLFWYEKKGRGVSADIISKTIFFSWFSLVKFNELAWHFFFCLLYSINALLLYLILKSLFTAYNYTSAAVIALISSVCYILSPFQTEVAIWGGDLNYLIVGFFIFSNIYAMVLYIERGKRAWFIFAMLAFVGGSFTHELGLFIFPADLVLLLLLTPQTRQSLKKSIGVYLLATIPVLIIYLINRLLIGSLIGRYGAETHLRFQVNEIVPALYKYMFKILLFSTFYPANIQNSTYAFMQLPAVSWGLLGLLTALLIFFGYRCFKTYGKYTPPYILFILFILFTLPVLNLYFPYWIKIQGDRYCYIPSAFLIPLIISLFFTFRGLIKWAFSAMYVTLSLILLSRNIYAWQTAGKIEASLEGDFKWKTAEHIYILNLPEYYRGAYMYRCLRPSSFSGGFMKYGTNEEIENKITEVLSYNLNEMEDSVIVKKIGENKLQVTLSTWGIWWWHKGLGATSYENEQIKVDLDKYNHSYIVTFKQKNDMDVILYCANGQWKEVQGLN